jgi:hypothetical protein
MMKTFTLHFFINKYSKNKSCTRSSYYLFNEKQIKAPERSVENILNFARSYKVLESKITGDVEMILN